MALPPRAFALVTLLAVAACARVETAGGPATRHAGGAASTRPLHPWTVPGLLRVAMTGSPNTLDPLLSTQQFEVQIEALIFDPLVAVDGRGRDVPILATRVPSLENGDISRDGLTIAYHLRRGVRWQDGAPFTSRDVAFTWHAIMNPKSTITTRHGWDAIARIDTPDAATAIFHLARRFAPAVHTFFAPSDSPFFVMPAHLLERAPTLDRLPFNAMPIGTGPYRLVRWIRGDRLELVANDRYFLGRPHIARIVVRIVPDENTVINQMRAHEIDWFVFATPRVYPQLTRIADVDVRLVPLNGFDAIMFNTTRPPFSDARIRRAIGLAIDKRALAKNVTYGTTLPATEDLPSFLWASARGVGTDRRDLGTARTLLDAAGWRLAADGIRVRAGARLVMGLAYRSDSLTDRNRGVVIASMLRDAGIDVALKGYTTSLYYGPASERGILASGAYDAGLQTWYSGVDPDDSTQLLCAEIPPQGYNWSRYCNPALDAAERVALTHYDRPTRAAAYARVERILARDAPFVYLWWPRQIEAINDDLHRFEPNGIVEDWNAYAWRLGA